MVVKRAIKQINVTKRGGEKIGVGLSIQSPPPPPPFLPSSG